MTKYQSQPPWEFTHRVVDEAGLPSVVDANGLTVFTVWDDGIDEDERERNGRLGAKAPEMAEKAERTTVVLDQVEKALRSLPDDALGWGGSGGADWPLRDELAAAVEMMNGQWRALLSQIEGGES